MMSRARMPLQPIAHLRIGEIRGALWALTDKGEGDIDMERALELTPSNANFRLVAGVHYLQSDKAKESVPHLRRYLELMPGQSRYLFRLLTGRESRAVTFVSDEVIGLEMIPDDPGMLFTYVSEFVGANSKAIPKILERAERLLDAASSSRHEDFLLGAKINSLQGDNEKAAHSYRMAILNKPDDSLTRFEYAKILEKLGRIDDALDQTTWLVRHHPANSKYAKMDQQLKSAKEKLH